MSESKGIKNAKYICLLLAAFLLFSGFLLMFSPTLAGLLYGIDDVELLQESTTLGMGIRQIVLGMMITVLTFKSQLKVLSYVMLISALVPLADFFIFSASIGWVSSMRHAASVPFIVGLGSYLLIQSRKSIR
jgi:hypothetical protein